MRTTVGEIEVPIALLKQPRQRPGKRVNFVRNVLGPNL